MRDRFRFARIVRFVTRATRWHHRGSLPAWLIALALVIVVCTDAIGVPAKQSNLLCVAIALLAIGFDVTRRQQQRRERAALAARLATLPSDDIPADVIELIAADRKIHAIARYRELTGAGLREAKAVIDSVVREG